MIRMAIDPGRDTGWAILDARGMLCRAGLNNPPLDFRGPVIIERPQIYQGRQSKADPNDILTLAIGVGRYAERFESRCCTVEFVLPHTWKGTVNPDVLCNRIVASLSAEERATLDRCLSEVAKGKQHNVIDAVGIAKWSVKRARAAVFA